MPKESIDDLELVKELQSAYSRIAIEIRKTIVGQQKIVDELLIALLCGGHVLLVGVPGLAKTLLISTLSKALNLTFSRIQFTPDLMPSDIIGTEVLEEVHHTERALQTRGVNRAWFHRPDRILYGEMEGRGG